MREFNRWLRSTSGLATLLGALALLLIVAVAGSFAGWWTIPGLPGTAVGGTTNCFPTCDETDGRMLASPGTNTATFAGAKIVLWLDVPAGSGAFNLGFFDGDAGFNGLTGGTHWDSTTTQNSYTLYADPLKNGNGSTVVASWDGSTMPDNAWFDQTINTAANAKAPSGAFFYRLEATRPAEGSGVNGWKLRATGAAISTGQADMVNANLGLIAMISTYADMKILYPNWSGTPSDKNYGESTYNGNWDLRFFVPSQAKTLEFWNGDFDFGAATSNPLDSDDPNTENVVPSFAVASATNPEGAAGKGIPADDNANALFRRSPAVRFQLVDPNGNPIYTDNDPSGTEEWERFVVSSEPGVQSDVSAASTGIPGPGYYSLFIEGLDVHNYVTIRVNYETCSGDCQPVYQEVAACPRTIGYWKNNVKKILIQNRTNGVQESAASLTQALAIIAQESELFRSGINVANPEPIATATPLTAQEANAILQKTAGNTMLDRALQQNLASWLNLASGKVSANAVLRLESSPPFEGTMLQALRYAEQVILAGNEAEMERAKTMADEINNGRLGENAPDNASCTDTSAFFPADAQPPKYKDMKKAPNNPNANGRGAPVTGGPSDDLIIEGN